MVKTRHVTYPHRFQVLNHQQICDSVLRKESNEEYNVYFQFLIYLLLVSILLVALVDVVAQFTFISLPITKRLFIASKACAAASC